MRKRCPGAANPWPYRRNISSTSTRLPHRIPTGRRSPCSDWAASGAPRRKFWQTGGVYVTAVGYAGGFTPNPTYEEVCTGLTGHNEVVRVVFQPAVIDYASLLRLFWESHDPTQGMRQGNDVGTQYRSGIYTYGTEQLAAAEASCRDYQHALTAAGYGTITTEILAAPEFYFAEHYHQQYLAKNPRGYCGLGGTQVRFPAAANTP